jgi:hypothetical protein
MRSRLVMACLVLAGLAGAAFGKGPKMILPLVPAQCAGSVPCLPDFSFKSGAAVLTAAKEPAPTCPKTGRPSETPGGTIRLTGVMLRNAAYSGALTTEVTNQTTFGSDGGDCSLNGLQITTPTLQGTLACKSGRCKGVVLPIACLPAECADVSVTTEFQLLEVLDAPTLEGGKAIARPGFVVAPLR